MQHYSQAEIVVARAISISPDNFGSPSILAGNVLDLATLFKN